MNIKFAQHIAKKILQLKATYENQTLQTSYIPEDLIHELVDIQKQLPENLYTLTEDEDGWVKDGRQELMHTTVLYGIEQDERDSISKELFKCEVETDKFDWFSNEEDGYDCLVLKLKSDELTVLHDKLKKDFSNKDKYDKYNPHITIGYFKFGTKDTFPVPHLSKDYKWVVENYDIVDLMGKINQIEVAK